jgi:hypothetical protein
MKVRATSGVGAQVIPGVTPAQIAPLGPVALALAGALIWALALRGVNIRGMSDLGLVSVLPPLALVAIGLLNVAFCLTLAQRPLRAPLVLFHCVLLIVVLYGMPTLVAEEPRFHVAWRHVGITEYIARNGFVNTRINAYFSWPGFFILVAFITKIAGLPSAISFVPWAPVFFNLLYLPALLLIFRSATRDQRLVWLGIWFFYITNWIGQDYFAPQALGYFYYLIVLGVVCRWFRPAIGGASRLWAYARRTGPLARPTAWADRWLSPTDPAGEPARPAQRAGLIAIVVALAVALSGTHQITPFFLLISVALLVIAGRCTARGLPILLAVVTIAWISFMTTGFLSGHIHSLVGSVGEVSKNVNQGVVQRVRGSPEHVFVVQLRLVATLALALLAGVGGLRRLLAGYRDLTMVLLMVGPCAMVAFMPYGGEMLLRVYLFGLPALAFFAAAAFFPRPDVRTGRRTTAVVALATLVFLGAFMFTRYGNERMDTFTHAEADAVRYVYRVAPQNSLLLAGTENLPWKGAEIEHYRYDTITRAIRTGDLQTVYQKLRNTKHAGSYLILTRSQPYFAESIRGVPRSAWDSFNTMLEESPQFKLLYSNEDARVYVLSGVVPHLNG